MSGTTAQLVARQATICVGSAEGIGLNPASNYLFTFLFLSPLNFCWQPLDLLVKIGSYY
jgi:hypothetical protein